jgi:carboxypeptidase Q
MLRYDEDLPQIPHAALTIEGAELLQRMQDRGTRIVVTLKMEAEMLPDALSHNVVAELVGREHPGEVVVIGGHIDSWDVGQGAMDDGGGVVVTWEAVNLLKRLGLRPRRTIRVVAWTNEENGLRGARAYRDAHADELDDHILAVEIDGGVFAPVGFGVTASDSAYAMIEPIAELLAPVVSETETHAFTGIKRGGGGADIGPLMAGGVPGAGFIVENSRYFWYHHTAADTMDKLDPLEMQQGVAALAILAYVVAEMPERLPR